MLVSNTGRFRDRNPDISAAGKLWPMGGTARDCLEPPPSRVRTPKVVKKYINTTRPEAGMTRVFYGKAGDEFLTRAAEMRHGLSTKPSLTAGQLTNPWPKTLFQHRLLDKRESLYSSHQKAPLGRTHDQTPNIPSWFQPETTTCGVKTLKDYTATELVNPPKSWRKVKEEDLVGKDLYKLSHSDYDVGESYDRKYDWSKIPKTSMFGVETPHDVDGRNVRKTLKWLHDVESERATKIVSKRVDDFRERTQPQLAMVHDPIKDTLNVGPDHTFGTLVKPDEYGAGDLIHCRAPNEYLRGRDRERGIVAAIRQHLKKANYHNFDSLLDAFRHYDRDRAGVITIAQLREVCAQFSLPIEPELMELLFNYCDVNKDGVIDYEEFANFLNWKDKMPSGLSTARKGSLEGAVEEGGELSPESTPKRLMKQIDHAIGQHRTSNSIYGSVNLGTKGFRAYGIPTVRSDLPAPLIKRVSDRKNYGDESNAYGLVNPSIYSNHGVHEKDFFEARPKTEIAHIFKSIGVDMDEKTFNDLWEQASVRHPQGRVSVESFRSLLDEARVAQMQADEQRTMRESSRDLVVPLYS
ncbi:PREDICTED: EF-hand domain-containing family member B-like [Branchiostoma belcheri]|uniref:EF-hand domain-containing family member B-like n=1 Tax=Branchiostoma belcheri TaxID=7741 RepID=A0A6P4Y741_BRABE|nr:PREDICTED: EF-hand domain-containing family member B-like [Branchiostoma belcheri]